ncbi:MAG TPA: hypothetical protein VD861_00850 [Pyrinomonadaceae bacterium]|nr:hypothetical protein [Pyrinomonadaceae bacterium]
MNAPRNNNASIFTAVICACLGVLVVGAPLDAHARRASSEVYRFERASVIRNAFQAPVIVRLRKSKLEGRWLPRPAARDGSPAEENFYQNDKPHAALHSRVVVTRLARAGLSESLA